MQIDPATIRRRGAGDGDISFAYEVKKAAFRVYVEPIWGWDEGEQVEFHRKKWNVRRPEIIQLLGRDIGTVDFWAKSDGLHLGEFYLLPEFQKRGIGSHIMKLFVQEADRVGVPAYLQVIKANPAQALYLRFGFRLCGETKTHYQMERAPSRG